MAIATDGDSVYWVDQSTVGNDGKGRVLRCAATGCNGAPDTLATFPSGGLLGEAAIAVDSSSVYWQEEGQIVKLPK